MGRLIDADKLRAYTYPVIGIWMSDYYICHPEELTKEENHGREV